MSSDDASVNASSTERQKDISVEGADATTDVSTERQKDITAEESAESAEESAPIAPIYEVVAPAETRRGTDADIEDVIAIYAEGDAGKAAEFRRIPNQYDDAIAELQDDMDMAIAWAKGEPASEKPLWWDYWKEREGLEEPLVSAEGQKDTSASVTESLTERQKDISADANPIEALKDIAKSYKAKVTDSNYSLLDVVKTLYEIGKERASKLFRRTYFDVAQTPEFMKELGLRGDKFTIKYGVVSRHIGKDKSHALTEDEWSRLPDALQNPFAITKNTDKIDSYRIYTPLKMSNGEYIVVGVDVKNAGRNIEVNSISTAFGRRNNANLSDKEEVIFKSKKITLEQSSLLDRHNFDQYPTEQELSDDKDTNKFENTTEKETLLLNESEKNENLPASDVERADEESDASDAATRFSIVTDEETIKRLDADEKVIGFRNVVLYEDGTFGSPMASSLRTTDRKATEKTGGFKLKFWERSEERPHLADENGKITLVKPDGKSVEKVDYNPYIHNRLNRVNKQFKQAWERPNLVYIKTEIPLSDIESGYHAEKAKLPVGEHKWNGGNLILSRYDKPIEICDWNDVADDWQAEFGKKKGINFDIIPPALLPILEERGMKIIRPHKNMGDACNKAYADWVEARGIDTKSFWAEVAREKEEAERKKAEKDAKKDILVDAAEKASKKKASRKVLTEKETRFSVTPKIAKVRPLTGEKALFAGMRELEEGEVSHVERVFTRSKSFEFSTKNVITGYDDVAYIFKELENEAVENTFAVLVKNNKPTVIHLGMGTAVASMADFPPVTVAVNRIKPDKLYFVHNHPSGILKSSPQDRTILNQLRGVFGDIVQEGIIINTFSGEYGVFDATNDIKTGIIPESEDGDKSVKVYSFSKQVYGESYKPSGKLLNSLDVASYITSQRLGDRQKMGMIVLNNQKKITGNIFLPYTDFANIDDIANDIAYYTSTMGGNAAILFGNIPLSKLEGKGLSDKVKNYSSVVLDYLELEGGGDIIVR